MYTTVMHFAVETYCYGLLSERYTKNIGVPKYILLIHVCTMQQPKLFLGNYLWMINHEARNITVCHFIHDNY